METVYKTICLEDFKSRRPGYSMSFDGIFENDDYNDYGKIVYDLLIPSDDKLMDIKDGIPLVKNLNDEYVLRYKNMINNRRFLMDIISGRTYDSFSKEFVNNTRYYKLCNVDGEPTWIELTDEMWADISGEENISSYDKFFLTYDDGTNVVRGLYSTFPNIYFSYYKTLSGNKNFYSGRLKPYYYRYYYKIEGEEGYRIEPVDTENTPPQYCYSYKINFETTNYTLDITTIKGKYYPLIVSHPLTIEKIYYDVETYKNIYNIGDIIGINSNADEYNERFCRDYEYAYGISYNQYSVKDTEELPEKTFENYPTTFVYKGKDTEKYKEYFNITLVPTQTRVRYDKIFLTKASNLLDSKTYTEDDFSEPFFDLNLYFEEEFDDSGLMSPILENWEANKKYKVGEIVKYNNETYVLKDINQNLYLIGKSLENAIKMYNSFGYGYEIIPISKALYEANKDNVYYKYRLKADNDGGYYLYTFYYKGYYSEKDRITYFDVTDEYGNLKKQGTNEYYHWKKTYSIDSDNAETTKFTAIYTSQMDELARIKTATDDDANILPFCFHFNDTNGEYLSKDTELVYMLGKSNVYGTECNFLYKVNIYAEMTTGKEVLLKSFKYTHEYNDDGTTSSKNYILCSDIEEAINSWGTSDTGRTFAIEFKYLKSCQIDDNYEYGVSANIDKNTGEIIDSTYGILHRDKNPFTIENYYCTVTGYKGAEYGWDTYTLATGETEDEEGNISIVETEYPDYEAEEMPIPSVTISGKTCRYVGMTDNNFTSGETYKCQCVFRYVNINDRTSYIGIYDNNLYYGVNNSEVTINKAKFINDDFQTVDYYKDDALNGIQNYSKNINMYIDRGTSSASERIFALGEIKTFDDLVKYRGDMYDLDSQKQK